MIETWRSHALFHTKRSRLASCYLRCLQLSAMNVPRQRQAATMDRSKTTTPSLSALSLFLESAAGYDPQVHLFRLFKEFVQQIESLQEITANAKSIKFRRLRTHPQHIDVSWCCAAWGTTSYLTSLQQIAVVEFVFYVGHGCELA